MPTAKTPDEALDSLMRATRDAIPTGWKEGFLLIEVGGNHMFCSFYTRVGGKAAPITNAIATAAVDYYTLTAKGDGRWREVKFHFSAEDGEGRLRADHKYVSKKSKEPALAIASVVMGGPFSLPKEPPQGSAQSKAEAEFAASDSVLRAALACTPADWTGGDLSISPKEGGVACVLSRGGGDNPTPVSAEVQACAEALIALMAQGGLPWAEFRIIYMGLDSSPIRSMRRFEYPWEYPGRL